jgi:hypothetical protein
VQSPNFGHRFRGGTGFYPTRTVRTILSVILEPLAHEAGAARRLRLPLTQHDVVARRVFNNSAPPRQSSCTRSVPHVSGRKGGLDPL